jgi:hypothetical protein
MIRLTRKDNGRMIYVSQDKIAVIEDSLQGCKIWFDGVTFIIVEETFDHVIDAVAYEPEGIEQ